MCQRDELAKHLIRVAEEGFKTARLAIDQARVLLSLPTDEALDGCPHPNAIPVATMSSTPTFLCPDCGDNYTTENDDGPLPAA